MRLAKTITLGAAASLAISFASFAGPTPDELARLGRDLTPVGAEKAGNKDGTIPAWDGGNATAPAGWKVGDARPNPFKDEKKLLRIDAGNVDAHKDKLPEGQIHLIKTKPGYHVDVYPSHRSCAYPKWYYERTAANAGKASVDGSHIKGAVGGAVPFPVPKTGIEAVWNFKFRYQGDGRIEPMATVMSSKGGEFNAVRQTNYIRTPLGSPKVQSLEEAELLDWQILNQVTAPPARNGEMILVLNYIDRPSGDAWLYFPGQRRVRRAPTFSYDNPVPGYENLEMVDQYPMYAGSPDRYDWKLVGKSEMYVPYNSYDYRARRNLNEIYLPEYTNRDFMRYELHRVWKVEGTVKEGMRHNASKRVFYIDEDSWQILHADLYDAQGKLWRVQEGTVWMAWELPACVQQEFVTYDLTVDRYLADNATQDSPETDWLAAQEGRVKANMFDPGELRRQGER